MTLACLCGGFLEVLAFLACAGFAWLTSLIRSRRASKPCARRCCARPESKPVRPD
jgi:hypothetical protein